MPTRLTKVDRDELTRLVAQRPGTEGRVCGMRAESRDVVIIMTGWRGGPRSGGGRVLRATRSGDSWQIEQVGGWRA